MMDKYELKNEIDNIKRHIQLAGVLPCMYENKQYIDWALKSILISELRSMNRSLEVLHDINRKIKF
jgi:hypothetical protein